MCVTGTEHFRKRSRNRKLSLQIAPMLIWCLLPCFGEQGKWFICFYHGYQAESERPLGKRGCLLKWSQLPKINWVFLSCALFSSSLASSFWHGVHSGLGLSHAVSSFQINTLVMAIYSVCKSNFTWGSLTSLTSEMAAN